MTITEANIFENFYSKFYFENDYSKEVKEDLGILPSLKTSKKKDSPTAEDNIIEKLLKGIYDSSSIAWKLGTDIKKNGDVDYRYYHFEAENIEKFCRQVRQIYNNSSLKSYKPSEDRKELFLSVRDLYSQILKINNDNNLPGEKFGAVQIINSIYFLSAGKAPIYDQYAHKAILALNYNISPEDIQLGSEFNKKNIDTVMCMYKEYLILLEELFPNKIYSAQNQFINRELDQALWVYGHCKNNWHDIEEKAQIFLNTLVT